MLQDGALGACDGVYGDDMVARDRVLGLSPVGLCCGGNFEGSMLSVIDQRQRTHAEAPTKVG